MTRATRNDPISAATTKRMAATHGRDNPRELALRSTLHRRGLRFRLHRGLLTGLRRTVDIVFPRARTAVFLDGCFWHGCPTHRSWPKNNADWWRQKIEGNIARDRDTDRRLREQGWTVLRIWEHEPIETAADRIEQIVRPALYQITKIRP
jgi:DNA mismatch endonuclease (patch repair protein)